MGTPFKVVEPLTKTCFYLQSPPSLLPGQRARRQQVPAGLLQPAKEPHGRPEEAQEGEGQEEPAVGDPRPITAGNAFLNQSNPIQSCID